MAGLMDCREDIPAKFIMLKVARSHELMRAKAESPRCLIFAPRFRLCARVSKTIPI